MKTRILLAAMVLGLTAFAPVPFPRPDKKDDLKRLEGRWEALRYEYLGNQLLRGMGLQVKVEGEKWSFFRVAGGNVTPSTAYTIKIDQKKDPRLIDFKMVNGTGELQGIYRFDRSRSDEVQFVFSTFGVKRRPSGFDGTDKAAYLLVLKRIKP
jgi:uncharacterized protein (TIGR03067 family)